MPEHTRRRPAPGQARLHGVERGGERGAPCRVGLGVGEASQQHRVRGQAGSGASSSAAAARRLALSATRRHGGAHALSAVLQRASVSAASALSISGSCASSAIRAAPAAPRRSRAGGREQLQRASAAVARAHAVVVDDVLGLGRAAWPVTGGACVHRLVALHHESALPPATFTASSSQRLHEGQRSARPPPPETIVQRAAIAASPRRVAMPRA